MVRRFEFNDIIILTRDDFASKIIAKSNLIMIYHGELLCMVN